MVVTIRRWPRSNRLIPASWCGRARPPVSPWRTPRTNSAHSKLARRRPPPFIAGAVDRSLQIDYKSPLIRGIHSIREASADDIPDRSFCVDHIPAISGRPPLLSDKALLQNSFLLSSPLCTCVDDEMLASAEPAGRVFSHLTIARASYRFWFVGICRSRSVPEQNSLRIDKLYAWVAEDADGEGIVSVHLPSSGQWLQLVGPDRAAIEGYRSSAERVAQVRGPACRVRLKIFAGGAVVDEI